MNAQPIWRIWPILWLLLVLQTTIFARLAPLGVHVDLALLGVVSVSLLLGMEMGAIYGLAAGVLTGYCAGVSLGSFALSRLAIGAGFGLFDRQFSRDNPLAPPLCAAGATVLANALFALLSPTGFGFVWWVQHTLISAALHALFIWPVYALFAHFIPPPRAYA
jgi:hypothetical protein